MIPDAENQMAEDLIAIEYDADPERCQAVIPERGQCTWKAMKDSTFCKCHGGNRAAQTAATHRLNNYRLTKFQNNISRLGNSDGVKSLRDEIGILRMLMEERLEKCEDVSDLMLQSHAICDLVMRIEKLVASCHKLEGSMGQLLDKAAILQFAGEVIQIISDVLGEDDSKITEIADGIMAAVGRIGEQS